MISFLLAANLQKLSQIIGIPKKKMKNDTKVPDPIVSTNLFSNIQIFNVKNDQ